MRRFLFSIVLLLTMMTVPSWAQGRYNVFAENQPLSTVLKQISAQSEYNFVYNNDLIDTSVKVTVTISSDNISDILDAVAGKTGLRYTIVGKQIAISVPEVASQTQVQEHSQTGSRKTRNVHGTVTDETGDPLAGADVYIAGTKTGAFTDLNGRYSIDVPDDRNIQLCIVIIETKPFSLHIARHRSINIANVSALLFG